MWETPIAESIQAIDKNAQLDAACKRLFVNRNIESAWNTMADSVPINKKLYS